MAVSTESAQFYDASCAPAAEWAKEMSFLSSEGSHIYNHGEATMQMQYWVISGEYDSADFNRLIGGTSEGLGTFQQLPRSNIRMA